MEHSGHMRMVMMMMNMTMICRTKAVKTSRHKSANPPGWLLIGQTKELGVSFDHIRAASGTLYISR
jgi:hypothetical protein